MNSPSSSAPTSQPELSPTQRTRLVRNHERSVPERAGLHEVLADGLIGHLGVVVDGTPLALPTAYAYDLDGPDRCGTLYLHGSVAARSLVAAPGATVSFTVTLTDALVLARAGFHHSMNYRSAVVVGTPRTVDDDAERDHALDLLVDRLVPGRARTLRPHTRKELAATRILALSLYEASLKVRRGGPADDDADIAAGGVWAGVVALHTRRDEPVTGDDCEPDLEVPAHVREWVAQAPLHGSH